MAQELITSSPSSWAYVPIALAPTSGAGHTCFELLCFCAWDAYHACMCVCLRALSLLPTPIATNDDDSVGRLSVLEIPKCLRHPSHTIRRAQREEEAVAAKTLGETRDLS